MAFIPLNQIFTTQADFEDSSNTRVNVDTSSMPGAVLLPKSTTQNIQFINQSNNFNQNLLTNLIQDAGSLKLAVFESHFKNVIPVRTTTQSEDSLQLDFFPILSESLVLKADGLTLEENTDYTWDPSIGKIVLYSSLSSSTIFEASYISQGILECEGIYESLPISIGDGASQLDLTSVGSNLSSVNIYVKQSSSQSGLSSATYQQVTSPISLNNNSKFLQIKLEFIPTSFTVTTIPVTFKYNEDWNLSGASFDNTIINGQGGIEILSSSNSISTTASLPVPTTVSGADVYTNPLTNDSYIIVTGGYESPTALSKTVRIAKINTNGSLGEWKNTSSLPAASAPYNTTKSVTINGNTYLYTLNNNNSKDIYKTIATSNGLNSWSTENPLPENAYRANLEIIKNEVTHDYFLVVQTRENIYWIKINNTNGTLPGNWKVFKLPDIQEAASSVLIPSSDPNINYLYILGGAIQDTQKKSNTDKISKVTITQNNNGILSLSSSYTLQKLPSKLSHFTSELITINEDKYIYIFGGTTETDTFGNGNTPNIQRIKIDPVTGSFIESGFSQSPNKLYIASSGLNTVLVSADTTNNVYVIGDGSRSSSRTSKINILASTAAIQSGTYTSGIFQVPGCNLQYNAFNLNTSLFNQNQSINSFYRISDTYDNLLAAEWVSVSNDQNLDGDSDSRFIQFKFILNRNPLATQEEPSPVLNNFTFAFTSHLSTLNQTPIFTSSTLTFDNYLYQPSGSITLRYDSLSNHTTYTDIPITTDDFSSNESVSLLFRTDDNLPLNGTYLNLTDLYNNDAGGRYIEVDVSLTASTDLLFSPVIQDITIQGLLPDVTNEAIGGFVYDEAPVGTQDEVNTHYTTAFTFESGSLELYVNGQKQTKPLIFIENVDNASFDFVSYAPDSLDILRVNYIKAL